MAYVELKYERTLEVRIGSPDSLGRPRLTIYEGRRSIGEGVLERDGRIIDCSANLPDSVYERLERLVAGEAPDA